LTPLFSLIVPNFDLFFRLLDKKFNEDFKNILKAAIFLLQMDFTEDFVSDCFFVPDRLSPLLYQILNFSGYWIENLIKISKM